MHTRRKEVKQRLNNCRKSLTDDVVWQRPLLRNGERVRTCKQRKNYASSAARRHRAGLQRFAFALTPMGHYVQKLQSRYARGKTQQQTWRTGPRQHALDSARHDGHLRRNQGVVGVARESRRIADYSGDFYRRIPLQI